MKVYLLLLWAVYANGERSQIQATMVTRQQCYAVVQLYREKLKDSPIKASCIPPHARYKSETGGWGGLVPPDHSWEPS